MEKQTVKKADKQLNFSFSLAKTPKDIVRSEGKKTIDLTKGEKAIHYLVPKKDVTAKPTSGGYHLQQILFNVDFRYGHDGINNIARQAGVDLGALAQGNVVVFFNYTKTAMKVAFSDRGIFHYRQNTKIEERAIPLIMKQLNADGKVAYPEALAEFLKRSITKH